VRDPIIAEIIEEFKTGKRPKPAFYADLMETVNDAR
jgi:hypothetical protein